MSFPLRSLLFCPATADRRFALTLNLNTGAAAQGATMFGRQAFVGLRSQRFGTVMLGRQYDSVNDYIGSFGFGLSAYGSGISHPADLDNTTHTYRSNNTVKYVSPNFNGLTFGGTVTIGGVAGEISQSSGFTLGTGYAQGPLHLAAAYQLYKNPSNAGAVRRCKTIAPRAPLGPAMGTAARL